MYQFFIIFLICLLSISPSCSEDISQLSFDQALELGIGNNPELQSERLGLNIKKADIQTAKARPNPLLFSDSGLAEDTYRVGLSYNFELGGKRKKRTEISRSILEKAELSLEEKILNFRQELRNAYAALFYAGERLKLRTELKLSFENLLKISKKRESLGDIAQVDVLQVETEMLTNESKYKKSIQTVGQARTYFEYLLNTELEEDIQLVSPQDSLDLESLAEDSLIKKALLERPELKLNTASQKIASQELSLVKTKRIPDLVLSAGPDIVTGDTGKTSAFVIAQIELPIFNRRKGEIDSVKALKQQLNSQKEGEANRIKAEVKKDLLTYTSQKEVLGDYDSKLIPVAKEYAAKRFRSFELGKAPIWVALSAQTQYINAQLEYIELSLEFQNTISSLERSIGVKIQ